MKIIGTVGRNGAGKDAVIEYLQERCGMPTLSIGGIARDIAAERGIQPTRENLHGISQEYWDKYSKDFFTQKVVDRLATEAWDVVAISGIRTPEDVSVLRKHFGGDFLLACVQVSDSETRYERLQQRDEMRDPDTFDEFLRQDRAECDRIVLKKRCLTLAELLPRQI